MKTKILLVLFIATNLLSCSKDSSDDQASNFTFKVEVQSVTDRSATITWTKPEGSNINYQIFLNNELIEDNFKQTAYTFNGLSGKTSYTGKIIASNGSQSTTSNFSFETQSYVPHIFDGGVYLGNQEEVNEFGSHHYNEITQDLRVHGFEVFDLTPLRDLKKVGGMVEIQHTTIQKVDGFENLEFIGHNLRFYNNKELLDINPLQTLTHVSGDLLFFSNTKLEDINGLKNVSGFTGAFQVEGSQIKHVNILNDATRLKNLYFGFNTELQTINGLQNVTVIDEFLDIDFNEKLTSLGTLNYVTTVGTYIMIGSTNISRLDLKNLVSVGDNFMINFNPNLSKLDDLNNLRSFDGYLEIWANDVLSDFCGISTAVLEMNKPVDISGNQFNPTLEDFKNGNCSQ